MGTKVIGIDSNSEKISVAHQILEELDPKPTDLEFVKGDLLDIPFRQESFDAIVCIEVISHVRDTSDFLDELRRVDKKHGLIYLFDDRSIELK